jgi:AcrR family transcriptional regulator
MQRLLYNLHLMPKVVDHDVRRAEVTAVAVALVVEGGRDALTVRGVADAAGYSTTVVSHYFTDMVELLHAVYSFAVERSRTRIGLVLAQDPADVAGLVEAVLPLDEERRDDWRIWFAFWSEALSSPTFADEQRGRAQAQQQRIERSLRVLRKQRRLPADVDIVDAAHRLSALIPGIAAEAIFDPKGWSAARQRRVLRSELALIGL